MGNSLVVIPVYNEINRFSFVELETLLLRDEMSVVIVDDCSSDGLIDFIMDSFNSHRNLYVIKLPRNQGKSEAVRRGLAFGFERGFEFIGVMDGDFSYSAHEFFRLLERAKVSGADIASGVRTFSNSKSLLVPLRFWQGWLFRLFINVIFSIHFRDIQCGLKIFRRDSIHGSSLETCFMNAWLYDLELILRNKALISLYLEVAVEEWQHKKSSNLRIFEVPKILLSACRLRVKYGQQNITNIVFLKS